MANFSYALCYRVVDLLLANKKINVDDYKKLEMSKDSFRSIKGELKKIKLIKRDGSLSKDFFDKQIFSDDRANRIITSVLIKERSADEEVFLKFGESESSVYNECQYALDYIFKDIPKIINLLSNKKYGTLIDEQLIQKLSYKEFTEILQFVCDIDNTRDANYVVIELDDSTEIELYILKLFYISDNYFLYGKNNKDHFIELSKINRIIPLKTKVKPTLIPSSDKIVETVNTYIKSMKKTETLSLYIPMSLINFLSENNLIEKINKIEPIVLKKPDEKNLFTQFVTRPETADIYRVTMTVSEHVGYMLKNLIKYNASMKNHDMVIHKDDQANLLLNKNIYEYFDTVKLNDDISIRNHHVIIAILITATYHNYIGYTEVEEFLLDNKDFLENCFPELISLSSIHRFYKNIEIDFFEKMLMQWIQFHERNNLTEEIIGKPLLCILKKCNTRELTKNYRVLEIQKVIQKSGIIDVLKKIV